MARMLHRVTKEELPKLVDWLVKHLPHSAHIYGTASVQQKGKWSGITYYTLGWPDILAVAEGPIDLATCPCPNYMNLVTSTCVFSPNSHHLEQLLNFPGFYDWTQAIDFEGVSTENGKVIEKVSLAKGAKFSQAWNVVLMEANPGSLASLRVPEGYEARPLDADLHAEYVASTWPHTSQHADEYVHALIKHLPAYGYFDREGAPVAVAVTYPTGYIGMLHVKDEARGRGLGKSLSCLMAQKVIQEFGRAFTASLVDNEVSIKLHKSIGYTHFCDLTAFLHSMDGEKFFASQ